MPRRAGSLGKPSDFVDGDFPDGQVVRNAPVGVAEVVTVARRLRAHIEGTGVTVVELARMSGVDRTTIHALLAGRAFIDVITLARLEEATGRRLWGEGDA